MAGLRPGDVTLRVAGLSRRFGGVEAVSDLSFEVASGDLLAVVGPNGAGKSTLFNLVAGRLRPHAGSVIVAGRDVTGWPPARRARSSGVGVVLQNVRLFKGMSALHNVLCGMCSRTGIRTPACALGLPAARRIESSLAAEARSLLASLRVERYADEDPINLPYGVQRMVAIARALAARPRLLLLDEPAAGLSAAERPLLEQNLRALHARGLTLILIEHDLGLVARVADRALALDRGRLMVQGPTDKVLHDPAFVAAYVGPTAADGLGPSAAGGSRASR